MASLLEVFLHIFLISTTAYTGSAQAVFYDVGVQQLGWISNVDYTNFLGFGFATPGPQVFSLATLMGFGAAGWQGAVVATFAIYLLPIILAILAGRYLEKWIVKDNFIYFIRIVGLAAAGVLFYIGTSIISANEVTPLYTVIAIGAIVANIQKVNPLFIIIAGLLVGLFI